MINNMMIGHAWLKKEFGVVPRIGWQIDTYGHSSTNARLFADFGFDALFLSRGVDFQFKKKKEEDKSYEFLWRPFSKHFGNSKQILVSTTRDDFCWFPRKGGERPYFNPVQTPIETDKSLPTFNGENFMKILI